MDDNSHLDLKYFIDDSVYNCPFCNRRNVKYNYVTKAFFDWSNSKTCAIWRVKCSSCSKTSMHLTFNDLQDDNYSSTHFKDNIDIDSEIFYSVPSSFFVVDERIPKVIRELITESEGCIKMNYLTGASACTRKAIYELLIKEGVEGKNYDDKIKSLSDIHTGIDNELFEILTHIKDMTSDNVHEQSWDKWDSQHLILFLETLKTVLHEIYVVPDEKEKRKKSIRDLKASIGATKKNSSDN